MTDPNADQRPLAPPVDPWADQTEPDTWVDDQHAATVAAPSPAAPLAPGEQRFSPGQASIPGPPASAPPVSPLAVPPVTPLPYGTMTPGRRGSRAVAVVIAVAVVVVIGVGALVVPKLLTDNTNPQPSGNGPTAGAGSSTGTPTTGPTASGTGTPTGAPAPTDPFTGTPATGYAKGADGIVLPDPPAVPGFTAAEVSGDLATVKQAVVASRLDPRMLIQHDTGGLLDLLAPNARASVTDSFAKNQQFSFATWLADTTTLTGDPVRVRGGFTITPTTRKSSGGTDIHEMDVTTNFIWVYPVKASRQGTGANLIVVHDLVVWTFAASAEVQENSQGLFFRESHAFGSNLDCTRLQQNGLVAISPTIHTTDADAGSQQHSPYNPDADVAQEHIVC